MKVAGQLTEEQMRDVAAYYASLPAESGGSRTP
jgi:cytochrome c553